MTIHLLSQLSHSQTLHVTHFKLHCYFIFSQNHQEKDWNYLLSDLDDAYEDLVKEFYANAIVEEDELKCWVRKKSFSVSLAYLAEILHINRPMLRHSPVYDDLCPNEELLKEGLGQDLEFSSKGNSVSVSSLPPKLRVLTIMMFHNLYP